MPVGVGVFVEDQRRHLAAGLAADQLADQLLKVEVIRPLGRVRIAPRQRIVRFLRLLAVESRVGDTFAKTLG